MGSWNLSATQNFYQITKVVSLNRSIRHAKLINIPKLNSLSKPPVLTESICTIYLLDAPTQSRKKNKKTQTKSEAKKIALSKRHSRIRQSKRDSCMCKIVFFRLVPSNNLEIYFAQVAPDAIHSMCLLAHRAQSFNSQKYEKRKKSNLE